MPNTTPVYNLKAALKETGLSADTLRAWERRYGLPAPQRTEGGHRLYSEYDIAMLKWLMARQNDGLSISRAVELWKEQVAQGKDPLAQPPASRAVITPGMLQQAIYLPPETGLDALRAQWLAACLNYNETAAEQTLNQAFSLYPIEQVCIDLLARGLTEIGWLWYENRASVQQEHFASNLAMRRLDALISASPAAGRPHTLVVGCPPDEWHNFSSLLLTLFLRRRGLHVIYLGANVPANRFEETLAAIQPDLIILSAQHLTSAASLAQAATVLNAHGATVAYGGRIFNNLPALTQHIPGHYLGETIETGLERVEMLLASRPARPGVTLPDEAHHLALKTFQLKRPLIENSIIETLQKFGSNMDYFATANHFMGSNLIAALQLGNLEYITPELDWLQTIIRVHSLPKEIVHYYLQTYAGAVETHMGANGAVIASWLRSKAS